MLETMLEIMAVFSMGGVLLLAAYILFNMAGSLLVWFDSKLNPLVREPEPINASVIDGSLYLRQGDRVLDVGRALTLTLTNGLTNEPDIDIVEPEQRRRIIRGLTVSMPTAKSILQPTPQLPAPQIVNSDRDNSVQVDL